MRIHIIACQVFSREINYYASLSKNIIDITWLPQGLHDTPDRLRQMVRDSIADIQIQIENKVKKNKPDAIVLGYGLCSNGVAGITAPDIPVIIPRTDDCIAVFLGSQKRYLQLFNEYSGTYWLNNGWIESAYIPTKENIDKRRQEYAEAYGEDNADFLMEQDNLWVKNYKHCGYISSEVYEDAGYRALAKEVAREHDWSYEEFKGDQSFIYKLVNGPWDDKNFLTCLPGYTVEPSYDETKIKAVNNTGQDVHMGE